MGVKARRSRPGDAAALAPNLRAEDVQEIKAASGMTPFQALQEGYEVSSPVFTVVTDDESETVVAMFCAIATAQRDTGAVWLLAAPLLLSYSKEFIKQSAFWLATLHEKYAILWNLVDARNTTHIGWLKLMGANFIAEHPEHGKDKVPFKEFIHV